jgi:hypothetical protein
MTDLARIVPGKHILYGSRNKTSPNLTKNDKLDGFYLEKKKCQQVAINFTNISY